MKKESKVRNELQGLAAVNYNMYFGSPAERADRMDEKGDKEQWTFEQALDELTEYVLQATENAKREEREELWSKIKHIVDHEEKLGVAPFMQRTLDRIREIFNTN